MRHILIIFFIFLSSFTVISCAKEDDSSSNSASSSSSSETSTSSSCPNCIVLYIDKESLSKYKTDNYLLFDPFKGHRQESLSVQDFNFGYEGSVTPDLIDLKENAHIMGPTFTIEMWIWSDQHGEQYQRIIGPNPYISFHMAKDDASEIRYGLNKKGIRLQRIIKKVDWYHIAITYDVNDDYIFYLNEEEAVSYTHLTLPTICSV